MTRPAGLLSVMLCAALHCAALLCAALLCAAPAMAEQRIALVIGNGAYKDARLANPASDARLMAQSLRAVGFAVTTLLDADKLRMQEAILQFGERLEKAGKDGVGLLFYAGHGVQANGRNYLLPVDAVVNREAELEVRAVPADWVVAQMDAARARLNILVLDACRNNPFTRSFRAAQRGLARMDAPPETVIAYSTSPGSVAMDGSGANSPYTEALAQAVRVPGISLEQAFKRVGAAVKLASAEQQVPWQASNFTGEFAFAGGQAAPQASARPAAPAPGAPAAAPGQDDMLFWQSVKDSTRRADFEEYLRQFPNGRFAGLARNRLAEQPQTAAAVPRPAPVPPPAAPPPTAPPAAPAPALQPAALAPGFPSGPVTLVVPYPPGGSLDITARVLGQGLERALGQPVIVENRAGAGGMIGAERVARAQPDGQVLLLHGLQLATLGALVRSPPVDPVKDLAPVGLVAEQRMVIVAHPDMPARSGAELAAALRANPGRFAMANAGQGATSHLCALQLQALTGGAVVHVPYRGVAPALVDLTGGQVNLLCESVVVTKPSIEAGRVRALMVSGATRTPLLPSVPAAAEAGMSGLDATLWTGLFAPAGTPRPRIAALSAALRLALRDPAVGQQLAKYGSDPVGDALAIPDALAARLRGDIAKWQPLLAAAGIRPE